MSRTAHKLMASGAKDAYEIEKSLQFSRSDSAKLTWNPGGGATSYRKWTFSAWVKRAGLGTVQIIFGSYSGSGTSDQDYNVLYFGSGDELHFGAWTQDFIKTNRKFRDVGAWYHIVLVANTLDVTTASERLRMYINGVEETSFATTNYPAEDYNLGVLRGNPHYLGWTNSTHYYDGYLAEVYLIDSLPLTPSSFAETDSVTGEWIPKEYTGTFPGESGYWPLKKNDRYSVYFDGSTSTGIQTADSSDFTVGTDNFTIEAWVYSYEDQGQSRYIAGQSPSDGADANSAIGFFIDANNKPRSYVFYSGGNLDLISSTAIAENTWYHIALVRNSNTFTLYLDGTSVASTTSSITVRDSSAKLGVGMLGEYTTNMQFKGWISNFRFVNGSAVYTSNFTPSTSPLTAVTNTKLLCCQNSTITTDNSGTSKTITVVNTANTYSQQMAPFTYDWYQDQSGQDNDWIADNLSINDVMQDSPTNNFSTMNPLDTGTYCTLSRGMLLSQGNTSADAGWSHNNFPMTNGSGKWYSEHRIGQLSATGGNYPSIGVSSTYLSYYNGTLTTSRFYNNYCRIRATGNCDEYGSVFTEQSGMDLGATLADDDIISIAVDTDNKKIWFAKNGTWIGSGNPGGNSNPTFTYTLEDDLLISIQHLSDSAASWVYSNYGQDATFNGNLAAGGNADANGYGDFKYAVPSGFKALCTQNLATPTVKNGREHHNTITYTGNSGTNNVTGMGFAPDLVWINAQGVTANHKLQDVVSGNTLVLEPDENTAGEDQSASFTAFASDGFNLASNTTEYNNSSYTYYAHGWKAGGATTTNVAESGSGTSRINQSWRSTNTDAGFSIIKYVGAHDEISNGEHTKLTHGLSSPPQTLIIKHLSETYSWHVAGDWMIHSNTVHGFNDFTMMLDSTAAYSGSYYVGSTDPDSTYIYLGNSDIVNDDGDSYICYAWHEVEGYSKFGYYLGNGSTDGPFIYTGFRPAWVMFRCMNASGTFHWMMFNTELDPDNPAIAGNWADYTAQGESHASYAWDILSNGFKIRSTSAAGNTSGGYYMFMAFAESPFKYANAR